MSPTQAAALGVRLFAIWLAIYCARWAPYLFGVARDSDEIAIIGVTVLATLASILAVLVLWFFPRTVAGAILPASDAAPSVAHSPDTWLAVGCALLGLWVLSDAAPGIVRMIYVFVYTSRAEQSLPEAWSAQLVYFIAEAAIGAWLLLGASGLRNLLRWARSRPN